MYKNIPAEMKQLNNWVCFKYAERNGKKTKIPVDPKTGNLAKSNDPHTWGSFAQAAAVADHSGFAGVGFMLDRSPFVGIDIDHCSYGQVIELECGYNIQFTEIDFDGLDFSFYGEGDDDFGSNDDEAEE